MIPESKICSKCNLDKPSSDYYTRVMRGGLYLQPLCIECGKAERKERYWSNKKVENHSSKLWHFRHGWRYRPESYYVNKVKHQRAIRLAVRLARANLIIELCMKEWEVKEREYLNGRMLLGKYEECATMATWIIRSRTMLNMEAISELFNCAVDDTIDRIKTAKVENSFYYGDIIVRMHCEKVRKQYDKTKPKDWRTLKVLGYYEYTPAQREDKIKKEYITPKAPPEDITVDMLIDTICWYYNVERKNFMSDDATRGNLSKARQVCMYIMNKHLGMAMTEIARMFDKNHSTISHNVKLGFGFMRVDKGNLYYELHRRFPGVESQTCPGEQMIS